MTTVALRIDHSQLSNLGRGFTRFLASDTASSGPRTGSRLKVPPSIPARQSYYWTAFWQMGERAADRDLEAGRYRDFADVAEAIDWLDAEA